ncbi:sigma-70 family RNA polymerase sigma factor [Streptomyces glomeratus]|uniref:RNA polymerase sigma factor n=2 Tax=Streptomyces glomeratus TaxID=284452 RepID=A0ABP6LV58_9ACTN|nr:sigma-70 family RNA polymerase sigma factor [Streptomyces glomeratus]MCF1507624.1 sigma-70 family RNA polymerase sigma factor [Streptomyces glomeratus]
MNPALPTSRRTGDTSRRTGDTSRRSDDTTASADESITAWALAARSGDTDAVERFVRAVHRDVQRYVAHLCADPQAVDDLAQDTFLRALGSLHRFEGRSSARAWLLSIARRAVIDSYRYAAARPRLSDVPDWQLAVELAQPSGLPGFDDGIALLDLLASLPDERREAFILTQMVGLPYAEAAEVSDCPVGTVRSRVARARATLMDLLEDGGTSSAPEAVGEDKPAAMAA